MKPSRFVLLLSFGLAGCGVQGGGASLVSAQYPPGTGAVNDQSQPQPINSLPPGAANSGPGFAATQTSYGSFTFGAR
jgi:hypothetical protein